MIVETAHCADARRATLLNPRSPRLHCATVLGLAGCGTSARPTFSARVLGGGLGGGEGRWGVGRWGSVVQNITVTPTPFEHPRQNPQNPTKKPHPLFLKRGCLVWLDISQEMQGRRPRHMTGVSCGAAEASGGAAINRKILRVIPGQEGPRLERVSQNADALAWAGLYFAL